MFQSVRIFTFFLLVALVKSLEPVKIMTNEEGSGIRNGYSSPKYKVLNKTKTYELREYEPTHWVATSSVGSNNAGGMFQRLYKYITGSNKDETKIPMTVPVATKVEPGKGSSHNFTMQFFLTASENPKPVNPEVFLTSFPKLKVYVRTYSGYSNDEKRKENIEALMEDVGKDNYDISYYFCCGYDAPWKLFFRHNEVWLLSKEEKE